MNGVLFFSKFYFFYHIPLIFLLICYLHPLHYSIWILSSYLFCELSSTSFPSIISPYIPACSHIYFSPLSFPFLLSSFLFISDIYPTLLFFSTSSSHSFYLVSPIPSPLLSSSLYTFTFLLLYSFSLTIHLLSNLPFSFFPFLFSLFLFHFIFLFHPIYPHNRLAVCGAPVLVLTKTFQQNGQISSTRKSVKNSFLQIIWAHRGDWGLWVWGEYWYARIYLNY